MCFRIPFFRSICPPIRSTASYMIIKNHSTVPADDLPEIIILNKVITATLTARTSSSESVNFLRDRRSGTCLL